MFDFLNQHQLYIVLAVTLLIWAGIVWYLLRLDKKIEHLEKLMKKDQ